MGKYKAAFVNNKVYTPVRTDDPKFTVSHYAGSVEYTADGFLEKNRDRFVPSALC